MTSMALTLDELMADCDARGIRLSADVDGGLTIDAPESAWTPELIDQIRPHKPELVKMLRGDCEISANELTDATAAWQATLDRLVGDPRFPRELLAALRQSDVAWGDEESREERLAIALEGNGLDSATQFGAVDPPEPCSECGSLVLWQSIADDLFGLTPGRWRCMKCDPPSTAQRLRERAARLKGGRTDSPKTNAKGDP